MRLIDHVGLNSNRTKPVAMTLRDVKFKFRSAGLSTLVRDMHIAAGGLGSGPHPGLASLNDKELALHHAMLERAGAPNAHTAKEIGERAKGGAMQFSPEQWKKFSSVMKTAHGVRLGGLSSINPHADMRLATRPK